MRSEQDLIGLLVENTILKRREDCLGCQYQHGSQKHHITCMTNIFQKFYFMKSIAHMIENDLIDNDEEEYLIDFVDKHDTSDD